MTNKSLPAYLKQILENHVERSELTVDDELEGIFTKLSKLNDNVERMKAQILERRKNLS